MNTLRATRLLMLFGMALSALLSGCATRPPAAVASVARVPAPSFEMHGRMSATDGARAAHGQVHWVHSPGHDRWTVSSPLGQIVAQLVSTPVGARLEMADGRRLEAADAQSMLPQLLGVTAPVDGLRYWIQASLRPGARMLLTDMHGRPARVADDGWIIDYLNYTGTQPDAPLQRLDASRGDARIRLVIDEWIPLP